MKLAQNIIGFIVIAVFPMQSCVAMNNIKPADPITISGTIKVVGNAPLTHVVLIPSGSDPDRTTADKVYLITGDLAKELQKQYQYKKVTLTGRSCASPSPAYKKCIQALTIEEVK